MGVCVCRSDGYVAVDHVELDIKEMLELGKRATVPRKNNRNVTELEFTSSGVRCVVIISLFRVARSK